jgi:mRNA-degrading endonuclease YafQ of YafQ-DinJ toxin-antitoxin module
VTRALIQSPAFIRGAKRFVKKQPAAAEAIRQTLDQLHADAFDPRLRTHKLKGELAGCWACSAGYDLRIVSNSSSTAAPKQFCFCQSAPMMKFTDVADWLWANHALQRTGRAERSL